MLSMPNVCHKFFRVPTMTEGFLEQVLILLFLKKKSSLGIEKRERSFSEEGKIGAKEGGRICSTY